MKNGNVFYELGFAQALNKPTLLINYGNEAASGAFLSGVASLRYDPAKPTALDYGIRQMLKAPHHGVIARTNGVKKTCPLGERAGCISKN